MTRRGRLGPAGPRVEWALERAARALRALPAPAPAVRRVDGAASRLEGVARSLHRSRSRATPDAGGEAELRWIAKVRTDRLVPVDQPLVLVSQVHRSGGTLLQRLLDGHPQLRVVPHELGPLLPARAVPLTEGAAWELLYDEKLPGRFRRGLKQARAELNRDEESLPFLLPPSLHRRVFERVVAAAPPATPRAMLDAYVTAYFNAWLEGPSLHLDDPRWLVGFEPEAIASPKRLEAFRAHYPDGRVISIVREPAGWYASARRWSPRFERLDAAVELWTRSARAALELAAEAPGRVLLVDFDDLVLRPADTTARVASFLAIDDDDALRTPTVGGVPVRANSSFPAGEAGVSPEPSRRADALADAERARIDALAGGVYREAVAAARRGTDARTR